LISLAVLSGYAFSQAETSDASRVIFYVAWYDVGKAALEGLPGVKKVENGFRRFKEINTVWYDSAVITIKEMEAVLKKAGTYLGTEWQTPLLFWKTLEVLVEQLNAL
jgi:copper chaperone CopZ